MVIFPWSITHWEIGAKIFPFITIQLILITNSISLFNWSWLTNNSSLIR